MTTRHDDQPLDASYAPRVYPTHDYRGEGQIVVVRVGKEIVGWMSRKDWTAIGWVPRPGLSTPGNTVRVMVQDTLRQFAQAKRPMVDAWAEVLNTTQHDAPRMGDLAKLTHR